MRKILTHTFRYWDGLPIHEATAELRIFAMPVDVQGAERKNWAKCVFANACKRLYGSQHVAFFPTRAYIELLDSSGNRRIERFLLSKEAKEALKQFDKTGQLPPAGFILKPPRPSETLKAARDRESRRDEEVHRAYRKKHAAKVSEAKKSAQIKGEKFSGLVKLPSLLEFRSGLGMVQFKGKEEIIEAKPAKP